MSEPLFPDASFPALRADLFFLELSRRGILSSVRHPTGGNPQ